MQPTHSAYPSLYQVNIRALLTDLSRGGQRATLDDLSENLLDSWAAAGFEWIWLLGVWPTTTDARQISRTNPAWRNEFEQTLPDLTDDDIAGSMFAVADYTVDDELGGAIALARLRERLHRRGLRLMLDFVPNHVGLGHRWVEEHPDYLISGSPNDLRNHPDRYVPVATTTGERIFAYGRDPNYAGWCDTLQLNYANPALQTAMQAQLLQLTEQCDGVRCDMAMLLLPEVFARTWGVRPEPFWPSTIAEIRRKSPAFTLLAEVYWDLEWELQQQGFDYCYDKRLYDRLRQADTAGVRQHLVAGLDYQARLSRFLENHDEPRAAATWSGGAHRAAAAATYLTPGMRFFHEGQFEGRKLRISPHLRRRPPERTDIPLHSFYRQLLALLKQPLLRYGTWQQLRCEPTWEGNTAAAAGFLLYLWQLPGANPLLAAINFAAQPGQCFVRLPTELPLPGTWRLTDVLTGDSYDRDGSELHERGLYLSVEPWEVDLFEFKPLRAAAE